MRASIYEVYVIVTEGKYGSPYLHGEEIFTSEDEANRIADQDRKDLVKNKLTYDLEVKVMKLSDWIYTERQISESEGYRRGAQSLY